MKSRILSVTLAVICATMATALPARPAQADRIREDQWHLRFLNTAEAHKISQGEGVKVAVIDSGVAPHPDLRNNLLPGTVTAQGESGDGQDDYSSHGTAMAGLIAAHSRGSSNGALGIAPKAKILPVRYSKPGVVGINDDLAEGVEWAIEKKARVISISAGGASSPRLRSAISSAISADILIIAAAGNQPDDLGVVFPAMLEGVVAVGATDRTGNRSSVSVTGKQLDIVAPGVDIYSTSINGKYTRGPELPTQQQSWPERRRWYGASTPSCLPKRPCTG